jgi:hypothetical protein
MVLQNCMDFLKIELGSMSETCPASSHDGNQIADIKVEEASDTQEVEDPLLITVPEIKAEPEVSCASVCVVWHISQISRIVYCLHDLPLSVCQYDTSLVC